MSDPIASDIAYVDAIVANSNTSFALLSANAQRSFDLELALLNSRGFKESKIFMDTFVCGYADYKQGTGAVPGSITYTLGSYYGDVFKFHGNLNNFSILSSGNPPLYTNNIPLLTNFNIGSSTYTLSAGPFYNALSNKLTFTAPTTTIEAPQIYFHANRFAFICQYLWSNPTNFYQVKELSAIPHTPIFNVKYGVDFNARSLLNAAISSKMDVSFYRNKQFYLTGLN